MLTRRTFNTAGLGLATLVALPRRSRAAEAQEFEIMKTDEEWKKILTKDQYAVLRGHGTERAGTSPLNKNYAPGTYLCAGCELALYSSDAKFDSGTGWPSFFQPLDNAVST